ncbi:hypothetical protein GCM10027347_14120 [Larkinella harenae]
MKKAVIDLGTNTFHLMIMERDQTLFRESRPAKIGKAGINQGIITEDATERAIAVLQYFRSVLDRYQIPAEQAVAIGTSAIRNAGNQAEFMERVRRETGIIIRSISGEQEADYIYAGVRAAGALDQQMALVVDIGGGSVEFILGTQQRVYWKQSFEIGGQRLLERFMETDPISTSAVARMSRYFQEQLLPLTNAVHQYAPVALVGSSGAFDTLIDMQYKHEKGELPPEDQTTTVLPLDAFYRYYELVLTRNRAERMQLPGMIELRVDMIVVSVCLIDYILRNYEIPQIRVSTYSLKEGVLAEGHHLKSGSF